MNQSINKIGIVTIAEGSNLGNRLQNYALQSFLTKMGFTAETLFRKVEIPMFNTIVKILKSIVKFLINYKNLLGKIQSYRS